jgi:PAS domain S-box-containing protein
MSNLRGLRLRKATLHTKLMVALAILIAVVAGGSATFLIERERAQRLLELEGRAARIADLLGHSLAQPLWNVDGKAIERQLAALASNPDLGEVTVTAVGYGTVVSTRPRRSAETSRTVVRARPIEYAQFESFPPQRIGEVTVVLTRDETDAGLIRARQGILTMIGVVVLAIYAGTYVLLKRMVRTPITRLEATVDRLAAGDLDTRCPVESNDEIGRLAERVNVMADRLRESTGQLRDSEQKYRDIFDNAVEGIFQLDRHGRLREANPAMAWLLGFTTPDALLAAVNDGGTGLLPSADVAALFETLAEKGEITDREIELTRYDGVRAWVKLNARGVGGSPVRPDYLEGFMADITARKHALEEVRAHRDQLEDTVRQRTNELREAKERAEIASRAKSAFIANISHELRTPLNGILGFAQVLRATNPSGERLAAGLSTIQRSGEHLLTLINDLLDIAKVEAGHFELQEDAVDVATLFNELYATVLLEAERKKVRLIVECPRGIPAVVADARRLRQVLMNLLGNAVKFTDEGEVRFGVEPTTYATGSVRLRFYVQDTGIGIPESDQQRIFEPFEQSGDLRRRGQGTGLGLTLSHQLVQQMGGRLDVVSQLGRGSTFSFELTVPVSEMREAAAATAGPIVTYVGPRQLILVADDVEMNRRVICDMLKLYRFEVIEARDGHEALELTLSRKPSLVLTDVWMPGLDGLGLLRELRQRLGAQCMPIIALSASAAEDDRQEALAAGAVDFLAKPVTQDELLVKLGTHLQLQWIHASRERRRVLVIEDNEDVRALVQLTLEEAGHSVAVAEDARRGIETALSERPDIVFIDIGLPDLSGYEVARSIRERADAGMTLIALTGYGEKTDRDRATAAGFDVHLVKPIDPLTLPSLIESSPARQIHRSVAEKSISGAQSGAA